MDPLRIGPRAARQIEKYPCRRSIRHVSDNRTLQPGSGVLVYAGPLRELRNSGVDLAHTPKRYS
jgi:hypothetical protein